MSRFYHLHCHSEASVADGLFNVDKWAAAYKDRGFKGAALTDHGTLTNVLPFYHKMRGAGLTPILGCEFYFADNPLDKSKENRKASHLILLAKNYDGLRNIMKLSKLSYTDGFYFRPRVGMEWLKEHSEGVVALSACIGGVLAQQIWREKELEETGTTKQPLIGLDTRFKQMVDIFGEDFYVEFQFHAGDEQAMINKRLHELRKFKGFQPVATNDCHYILPEHAAIQNMFKEMVYKTDAKGQSYTSCDSLWLKNASQVYSASRRNHEYLSSKFVAEGMGNTEAIFEKCRSLEFPKKRYLPTFRSKSELTTPEIFERLTNTALRLFLRDGELFASEKVYRDRFKKEFDVISKYGLQDYFLIVWDIIRFCKSEGIYTGIGRGSAAGCFISYLLGIVKIDPIEHKLIFERFLNENRCESGELPDIDLDIESERRQEVKDYVFRKYGRKNVCEIGTYGRMRLKTCLLDFGMALKVTDKSSLMKITTAFDLEKEDADDLDAAMAADPRLSKLVKSNAEYGFAVRECIGQIKSQSVHPAGLLICSEPIDEITPVKTQKKNKLDDAEKKSGDEVRVMVTQCEDKYVVAQGLMKVDLLGLKEYDIVKAVLESVESKFTVDNYVERIMALERQKPDAEVWKYFQKGKTEGVFQFASDGMQQLLIDMVPTCINDLCAANALFRPGCLENGWHTMYCRRKAGDEKVRYPHADLEEALGDTYGVIVYQEQFMTAIHKLGDVSLVDSDTIRSALGKKDKAKLEKFKSQFVDGASKKIGLGAASDLWDQIEKASGYSFNRCVAGSERFLRGKGRHDQLTIGDMWRAKNDRDWANLNGKLSVSKKYRRVGYGKAWSLVDGRLKPNNIVDIRHEGVRPVFRVSMESGEEIDVTANHKFPTPTGEKMLMEMAVGDPLYVCDGYEVADSTGEKGLKVRVERILAVEYLGEQEVFDVEMASPSHTFAVRSGIVTANSHSAVYSVLAYISQYLKVHYPAQFWSAQLEWYTRKNKSEEIVKARKSALEMGVGVITPHINKSRAGFAVVENEEIWPKWNVTWSFRSIKGVGLKAATAIQAGQPYKSVADFYSRVEKKNCRFNNMVSLAYAGAFDKFGDRKEVLRELHRLKKKDFKPPNDDQLMLEYYGAIGFFEQKLKKVRPFSRSCITEQELRDYPPGESIAVGGMISAIKQVKTKRGDQMGFVTLVDLDESIELTLFPTQWSVYRASLHPGRIIQANGVKSGFNDKQNVVEVREIKEM